MQAIDLTFSEQRKRKAKTRRLVKRFQEAVSNLAFKGASHPDDHEAIELEYTRARKALLRHIDEG